MGLRTGDYVKIADFDAGIHFSTGTTFHNTGALRPHGRSLLATVRGSSYDLMILTGILP
ncbi:hypothetical protein ACFL39_01330 [Gemmatimonadota bacterium]